MAWDKDLGDEPPPAWRDHAPDVLAPIDDAAPVSGHRGPRRNAPSAAEAPEHDWLAAEAVLMPVLRPAGTSGTTLSAIDPVRLASEGMKTHAMPLLDEGPAGLVVGYVLPAGSFDVHVNADHLLAWGATPDEMRAAAMANLARWSSTAPWTEEASGSRRILSSAAGGGGDATRVLLAEVRADLAAALGAGAKGGGHHAFAGLAAGEIGALVHRPIGHGDQVGDLAMEARRPHHRQVHAAQALGVVNLGFVDGAAQEADALEDARRFGRGPHFDFPAKGGGLRDAVIDAGDCGRN